MNERRCPTKAAAGRAARLQKGAVALAVAASLPVLIGVAALTIDLAYVHVVRSEMQNDADAAALAGANVLLDPASGALRWGTAVERARAAVRLNSAAGNRLRDATVETGFWNLRNAAAGLQASPVTPGAWDAPAVSVTLRKQAGQNDGPVQTFLARFWQVLGIDQQVTAVAVLSGAGQMTSPFPLALPQCLYDRYWDSSVYPPRPRTGTVLDSPFMIRSQTAVGDCSEGRWTSLLTGKSDVTTMRGLIADAIAGSSQGAAVSIGQAIFLQPGTEATIYRTVRECSAAGDGRCARVFVPVVERTDSHGSQNVTAFACLEILDARQGQNYVSARASNACGTPPAGGAGPNYGVRTPSSLVR